MRNQRVARELGGAWCQADRAWLVFFLGSRSSKNWRNDVFFFSFCFGKGGFWDFCRFVFANTTAPTPSPKEDMGDLVLD